MRYALALLGLLVAGAASAQPTPVPPRPSFVQQTPVTSIAADQALATIPANGVLRGIYIQNTTANAVTGGVDIGTTAGAADVASAVTVGANGLVTVTPAALLKQYFSASLSQQIFIHAHTAWNSANLTAYVTWDQNNGGTYGIYSLGGTLSSPLTVAGTLSANGLLGVNTTPDGTGGSVGTIVANLSAYRYPSSNERARWWSSLLTVTGTQSSIEEANFFNLELSPLASSSGSFVGTVGTVTASVIGGAVQSPLTISVAGSGQPNGTYNLVFGGGGGSGATGTATVSGGAVTATNLTAAGTGYTTAPTVQIAEALVSGENNQVHPYGQIDSGINFTSLWDPLETSFGNHGVLSGTYQAFNGLYNNFSDGITTGTSMGVHLGVINNNTTAGSVSEYDGVYLQPFSGGGTVPTSYFFLKNVDSAAGSVLQGNLALDQLQPAQAASTQQLFFRNTNNDDSHWLIFADCNTSTLCFELTSAGNMFLPKLATVTGPACFLSSGELFDGQRCNVVITTKTTNFTLTAVNSGQAMDNIGAAGTIIYTLPAASAGLQFCFSVMVAQTLEVLAVGTDKIAIGASNSLATGNIQANTTFSSVCIEAHGTGQWVSRSHEGTWTVN